MIVNEQLAPFIFAEAGAVVGHGHTWCRGLQRERDGRGTAADRAVEKGRG